MNAVYRLRRKVTVILSKHLANLMEMRFPNMGRNHPIVKVLIKYACIVQFVNRVIWVPDNGR